MYQTSEFTKRSETGGLFAQHIQCIQTRITDGATNLISLHNHPSLEDQHFQALCFISQNPLPFRCFCNSHISNWSKTRSSNTSKSTPPWPSKIPSDPPNARHIPHRPGRRKIPSFATRSQERYSHMVFCENVWEMSCNSLGSLRSVFNNLMFIQCSFNFAITPVFHSFQAYFLKKTVPKHGSHHFPHHFSKQIIPDRPSLLPHWASHVRAVSAAVSLAWEPGTQAEPGCESPRGWTAMPGERNPGGFAPRWPPKKWKMYENNWKYAQIP